MSRDDDTFYDRLIRLASGLLALLFSAGAAHAEQKFPAKPIRLIVPAAFGDPLDLQARRLALKLADDFRQAVVVDNRPGGDYILGIRIAVDANPDGYTVILVPSSYAAIAAFYKLSYDSLRDVTPIALVGESGFVVTLHPSHPVGSVKELIAYAKKNPGKLHYGAVGVGSGSHRAAELFNQMADTKITSVSYKLQGVALNDLIDGQIQLFFGNMPMMIPQIKSKRVRGIAVTTAKRCSTVPEIPTVSETIAGYEAAAWQGILGPRGLPEGLVARWNNAVNRAVQLPDVRGSLAALCFDTADGSPQQFRAFLEREIAKWQKVVRVSGIKPER